MKQSNLLLIVVLVIAGAILSYCIFTEMDSREGMSGFGVITAIGHYNRNRYCDPGWNYPGAAYHGGCYLPHRVIF